VLDAVARSFEVGERAEITLEANPGASDAERFAAFRDAGINRLSIGVQSFQPEILKKLGRAHSPEQAEQAFRTARAAGFGNVSLDFIYGVQGETVEQAEADAVRAASLEPEHLSAYALTLDRESLAEEVPLAKQLARGEVALPPDDTVVEMNRRIAAVYAERRGLVKYEISNYARPGYHSRHNALYWTGGEYLALGVGATGFLKHGPHEGVRFSNQRNPERYLVEVEAGRVPSQTEEPLGVEELYAERVAMGLRLSSGIDLEAVAREYGRTVPPLDVYLKGGLATLEGAQFVLTPAGADVHSAISARLI
jgi:oxygen-independent coproporphyrinogen-3 oxidase